MKTQNKTQVQNLVFVDHYLVGIGPLLFVVGYTAWLIHGCWYCETIEKHYFWHFSGHVLILDFDCNKIFWDSTFEPQDIVWPVNMCSICLRKKSHIKKTTCNSGLSQIFYFTWFWWDLARSGAAMRWSNFEQSVAADVVIVNEETRSFWKTLNQLKFNSILFLIPFFKSEYSEAF